MAWNMAQAIIIGQSRLKRGDTLLQFGQHAMRESAVSCPVNSPIIFQSSGEVE